MWRSNDQKSAAIQEFIFHHNGSTHSIQTPTCAHKVSSKTNTQLQPRRKKLSHFESGDGLRKEANVWAINCEIQNIACFECVDSLPIDVFELIQLRWVQKLSRLSVKAKTAISIQEKFQKFRFDISKVSKTEPFSTFTNEILSSHHFLAISQIFFPKFHFC